MIKEHLEFHGVDMSTGWTRPEGYPEGIDQKILCGSLNEAARTGSRTRLLRFQPGAFTTLPFVHEYWEEVFLLSGKLIVDGAPFKGMTYACRPPHVPHGPFATDEGCLLLETHFFDNLK